MVSMEDLSVEPVGENSPEDAVGRKERQKQLKAAIDALPEMYRLPILLYHLEGMSYQEISKALKIPLSKVKNRIFRGRKLLRENLFGGQEGEKNDL